MSTAAPEISRIRQNGEKHERDSKPVLQYLRSVEEECMRPNAYSCQCQFSYFGRLKTKAPKETHHETKDNNQRLKETITENK
jgi:hypothetical protein